MTVDLFPYAPERDVYRLLQVQPEADSAEVVAACRRLAHTFHPDRSASPFATQEMQVVNAIRRLFGDPRRRALYDAARRRFLAEALELQGSGIGSELLGPRWVRERMAARLRRAWSTVRASAPGDCPACGAAVTPDFRFCGTCGNRLVGFERLR